MSNLRPVPRADKNGKIVTRHVKDDQNGASSRKLPAPNVGLTSYQEEAKAYDVVECKERINRILKNRNVRAFRRWRLMRTLNPHTIAVLLDHEVAPQIDRSPPRGFIECCEAVGSFTPLDSYAAYLDDGGRHLGAERRGDEYDNYESLLYLIGLSEGVDGLSIPPHLAFTPYAKASPEERAIQRKVIEATHDLGLDFQSTGKHIGVYPKALSDYRIMDYIRNNPEKSEALVKVIKDRNLKPENIGDVASLMSVVDEVTTPLLDGTL